MTAAPVKRGRCYICLRYFPRETLELRSHEVRVRASYKTGAWEHGRSADVLMCPKCVNRHLKRWETERQVAEEGETA
jgi:hypothetical protein